MDNMRGQESRKGQTHNNTTGGSDRNQPLTGFEGMNYEQKRRPYMDGKNGDKTNVKHSSSNNEVRQQRENG